MARNVEREGIRNPMQVQALSLAKVRSKRRGAVMVEYAFLLALVVVPGAAGLMAGGKLLHDEYVLTRTAVLAPVP
jgi:hypothetical protein